MATSGWIGVDLDGTLAEYSGWANGEIGRPIPRMVERIKRWLREDVDVRIFTARVCYPDKDVEDAIKHWCRTYIGKELPVTCKKDFSMIELWDDRAVQVEFNTGRRMDGRD